MATTLSKPRSCGEPVCTPKRTGPESRPDLRRSLLCVPPPAPSPAPAAQACGQVLLLGSLNSASPPDFPAFNGAALQAGTGPEGFLFLSSRFSPPPLICSALPGGPPSAVGSDPYYGRGEKGRTRTPPECRERFLELPDKKHPPLCLWMCARGCQLPALPIGDTGAGTR